MCLSWLHAQNLPKELWAAAIQAVWHVINHPPHWHGTTLSPFELLYNHKFDVSYFRVFGSICYVHISKTNQIKLDLKAKHCIFVGYDFHRK